MKTTLLVAMLAVIGLTACEKTTVNPPATSTTVVRPVGVTPAATASSRTSGGGERVSSPRPIFCRTQAK